MVTFSDWKKLPLSVRSVISGGVFMLLAVLFGAADSSHPQEGFSLQSITISRDGQSLAKQKIHYGVIMPENLEGDMANRLDQIMADYFLSRENNWDSQSTQMFQLYLFIRN